MGKILAIILILIISIVFVVAVIGGYLYYLQKPIVFNEEKGIVLTQETIPAYLEEHPVIEALPEEAEVQVNFGEFSVEIKEGAVERVDMELIDEKIDADIDVIIKVPEEYIEKVGEDGLCEAAKEAIKEGELEVETDLNKAELMWKYKGLLKYRNCVE